MESNINAVFSADLRLAPTAVRLGFHMCGTFNAATGVGGCRCPIDQSAGANQGFVQLITALQNIQTAHGASFTDVVTLSAVVAVQAMSGPTIPWISGRVDYSAIAPQCSGAQADVLLPNPSAYHCAS